MDTKAVLTQLRSEWGECTKCDLHKTRPGKILFGAGSITNTKYLLVYDAPTAGDLETRTPFSGEASNIVSDLLEAAEILPKDCYTTTVLGCRPTTVLPATEHEPERVADRAADKTEVAACYPRLAAIIYAVDPRLIFTLGDLEWKTWVRTKDRDGFTTLDKAVGNLVVTKVRGQTLQEVQYPVLPLLPIKTILASPSLAKHGTLGITLKHLLRGKAYVDYVQKAEDSDRDKLGT